MKIPRWLTVVGVVLVVPAFGYGLGLGVAYVLTGGEMWVLPVITIPAGLIAGTIFALCGWSTLGRRFWILLVPTILGLVLMPLLPYK